VLLRVNPDIARALREEESGVLRDLRQSLGRDVTVKADHQLHNEQFDLMAGTEDREKRLRLRLVLTPTPTPDSAAVGQAG
jgi:hypothetical protein